jgi:PD-(D/E)XK nuclease superfamily
MALEILNKHEKDDGLIFDEQKHKYTLKEFPELPLISVTSFLHDCFEEFNADIVIAKLISQPKGKYYGKSAESIKNEWKEANMLGTKLHLKIEHFMNVENLAYPYSHEMLLEAYDNKSEKHENEDLEAWNLFLEFVKAFQEKIPFRTEWRVYSKDLQIAGSLDMTYINEDGTLSIYDWKRTTDLEKRIGFNEKMSIKFPESIPDTKFHKYSLQLNLYKAIVEKHYGYKVKDLYLVGLHPKNNCFQLFECADFSEQVQELFDERRLHLLA